jgi:hypothetical protein
MLRAGIPLVDRRRDPADLVASVPPAVSNERTPLPPLETVRISMEDVVSDLEHRYQGRQAN